MIYYTQMSEFERVRIYEGLKKGWGPTAIGESIGRDKSTISRELKRNSDYIGYLYPRDAHKQTKDRKAVHGPKIERHTALKSYVLETLRQRWSLGVIAGRWKRDNPSMEHITAEAIYTWIYWPKNKHLELWKFLPKAKRRRGKTRRQYKKKNIMHRVSIHERPAHINTREEFGHYEGDLMFNQGSQSANILTLVERTSRMVTLVKHETKQSKPIADSIKERVGKTALSCTFDNGPEFASHHTLGIPTYFCDPASPWQKGSVENMNGLARMDIPFSMQPDLVTQEYLDKVAHKMNNKPRKILDYQTPYEVFMNATKIQKKRESRKKPALPAVEAICYYQNSQTVALHY